MAYDDFYPQLHKQLLAKNDFATSLRQLLAWCDKDGPHPVWKRLAKLDYTKDVAAAKKWVKAMNAKSPARFPVRGIWFGLAEFADDDTGGEYADLYYGLMGKYDAKDSENGWLWKDPRHYPDECYAKLKNLIKGSGAFYLENDDEEPLGVDGNICFSIGYAALLARELLTPEVHAMLKGKGEIGVVLGFDGGDLVNLGSLHPDGFQVRKKKLV